MSIDTDASDDVYMDTQRFIVGEHSECKPGEIHLSIRELVAAIIWNNEAFLKVIAGKMDKLQLESGTTPRSSFLGLHLLLGK